MTSVWNFYAHPLGFILQGIPSGGVTCHYVSILRLCSSWIQSTQSKIDCRQYISYCFPLQVSTTIWVQGDFLSLITVWSHIGGCQFKDRQYLSAWVNFVICLFVCLIKGWDLSGYKKHYPSTSDVTVFRPGGGEGGAGLRLPSLESWVTSKTV